MILYKTFLSNNLSLPICKPPVSITLSLSVHSEHPRSVSRAISRSCDVPDVGFIVYYYPRLHQRACQGNNVPAGLLVPARVTAEVVSRRLRANREGGQDVFAEFLLQPVGDDSPTWGILLSLHISPSLYFYVKFCFQMLGKCRWIDGWPWTSHASLLYVFDPIIDAGLI